MGPFRYAIHPEYRSQFANALPDVVAKLDASSNAFSKRSERLLTMVWKHLALGI
jgi:hypothetical protein